MKVTKLIAPGIIKMKVVSVLVYLLLYSIYIQLPISVPQNSLQIICTSSEWWILLKYDGLKYHVNVTEGLKKFKIRGSRSVRRRPIKTVSINIMVNYRKIGTCL